MEISDEYGSIVPLRYLREWQDRTHEIPEMHRGACGLHSGDDFFHSYVNKNDFYNIFQSSFLVEIIVTKKILQLEYFLKEKM